MSRINEMQGVVGEREKATDKEMWPTPEQSPKTLPDGK